MKFKPIKVTLDQLYLDPNNYRFIDQKDYSPVEEKDITQAKVQTKVMRMLTGISQDGISDLLASIKANGFLEFEQIQVRLLEPDKYLVIEGNRRVCALKSLKKQYEQDGTFDELIPDEYNKITVSLISGYEEKDNFIAMGLQHIGGKRKWNPLNQARLLRDLSEKQKLTEDEICSSLGISRNSMRTRLRALSLAESYRKCDYGDQFKSDMFSIFEEVVKRPQLRLWLDWSDDTNSSRNLLNQERLFNWISYIDEDSEHNRQEPIILKSAEIRELDGFISDEKAIRVMEQSRSFAEGKMNITSGISKITQSIDRIKKEISEITLEQDALTDKDFSDLHKACNTIKSLVTPVRMQINDTNAQSLAPNGGEGFSRVTISHFRGIYGLTINRLSRINLFVGANNSGKTSLLEAVYLLTQLNDLNKYLFIERFRGRTDKSISPAWMAEYLDHDYEMTGIFNNLEYVVKFSQGKEGTMDFDKQGYLTTLHTEAHQHGDDMTYQMILHLYERKEQVAKNNKTVRICPAAFSSAYRKDRSSLLEAHSLIIENNTKSVLIDFIKKYFDESISDINLVIDDDNARFMVTSARFPKAVDITKFGEGLQRIVEISLYVLSCRNGCAFIDEIDSAVHKSLLDEFIGYIVRLCQEYNVQLFTSTHNRECVDSFVKIQRDVMAYRLAKDGDRTMVTSSDAASLLPLMDQFNMDIR